MIAMSTALKRTNPFVNLLGHASVMDEKGEEMHKSKGNAIEFNEAADEISVDVMRWLYLRTNPENNVNFGYNIANEIKRFFHLRLWNVYSFFVMYANLDNWKPSGELFQPKHALDRWIISRMNGNLKNITFGRAGGKDKSTGLINFNAFDAVGQAEIFIHDLSNWYVRRIRDRVGPEAENIADKGDVYQTLWIVLTQYSKILAPFIPFIAEHIYRNLTDEESVHLTQWPEVQENQIDEQLEAGMEMVMKIVEKAHAKRKEAGFKLRQPLASVKYKLPEKLSDELEKILAEELNVKKVEYEKSSAVDPMVTLDTKITQELEEEGKARDLIRQIQQFRKEQGLTLADKTQVIVPSWPVSFETQILKSTASVSIVKGDEFKVLKIDENSR